jgi:hypothetical protein
MTDPVIVLVNRANQRGGRMLSVVDLLEAETLSLPQAAWLLARVREGSSWLAGARPGGAGKTAVMCALLAMVPPVGGANRAARGRGSADTGGRLLLANPGTGWETARPGDTVVAYELSPGSYDAYLWGADVARLAELGRAGCRIVSNLHADTLEEAREQVVGQCGADEREFGAFELFLPLEVCRGGFRAIPRVEEVWWYHGDAWRRLVREPPAGGAIETGGDAAQGQAGISAFLEDCLSRGIRRVEEVRARWLEGPGGEHRRIG